TLKEPEPRERRLLERVAEGDKEAFRDLYYSFGGELQRYVFLFTHSREDTEEILQDVFVKLWERRQMLVTIASFRGYIYRMARNRVLNYFRSAKARVRTEALSEREQQQPCETGAADQLLYKQYYKLARQAISLLPERRKEVFLLRLEEGLSLQEIADQLRVSKSAVKQHLYSASGFIREYLRKHGVITVLLFQFMAFFE
ncbi:MAG TPA: RNA polymerase sigma-70 factor, partial [Anseongella sp.]|nr:RNA polymerase sigma-70 factor [Anseongella sp.]